MGGRAETARAAVGEGDAVGPTVMVSEGVALREGEGVVLGGLLEGGEGAGESDSDTLTLRDGEREEMGTGEGVPDGVEEKDTVLEEDTLASVVDVGEGVRERLGDAELVREGVADREEAGVEEKEKEGVGDTEKEGERDKEAEEEAGPDAVTEAVSVRVDVPVPEGVRLTDAEGVPLAEGVREGDAVPLPLTRAEEGEGEGEGEGEDDDPREDDAGGEGGGSVMPYSVLPLPNHSVPSTPMATEDAGAGSVYAHFRLPSRFSANMRPLVEAMYVVPSAPSTGLDTTAKPVA